MRRLILQMQTSLDGYVAAGPDDDQTWVTWDLDSISPYVLELSDSTDTILLGRKLAVDYIPFWEETVKDPEHSMHSFATRIVAATKVIFTKTLEKSEWNNTVLAKGDLIDEVNKLKQQAGKDMVVYGGVSFVTSLIRAGVVDEYHFYINPVALGKGFRVFDELPEIRQFQLRKSVVFDSGIVYLVYGNK